MLVILCVMAALGFLTWFVPFALAVPLLLAAIGDPFKDTSGPSINILIKLLSMVSIVFAALVVIFRIFG